MQKNAVTVTLMIVLFISVTTFSYAQSVAINTTGAVADASSILDITHTGKGVLIPRMTATEKGNITSPATGLLIYQTDSPAGFYYNSGTPATPVWVMISSSAGGTVTSVATGAGLTGGTITSTGTIALANGSAGGQILVTGATPFTPALQTLSGDCSLSVTGALTIANNAITSAKITDANVTYAKIQNVASSKILGNPTGAAAAPSEITLGSGLSFTGSTLNTVNNGSVTTASVVSANGFAGSVATASSTPAITLSTTVTGLVKGNGTAISAAVAGTDYLTPTGSAASLTGFPTFNQNTTGNAATATLASTVTTNANLTGDVTSSGNATTYGNVVPAVKGGAGNVSGILKANGSGTVSAATAGTDYLTPTGSAASLTGFPTLNQNTTGTAANITGTLSAGSFPALTGAVTTTAGSLATTLAANAVTTAKIADANVTVAKLSATGTASANTFLRGDGSWSTNNMTMVTASANTTLTNVDQFVYVTASGVTLKLPATPTVGQRIFVFTDFNTGNIDTNNGSANPIRQSNADYAGVSPFNTVNLTQVRGIFLLYNGTKWFTFGY